MTWAELRPAFAKRRYPCAERASAHGLIARNNQLFSVPETNYLNYMLNRSEYSNGKDLRNKYIHSTYPMEEDVQMQDYMDLLKIMIIIIGKNNEEILVKCTKSDENNQ